MKYRKKLKIIDAIQWTGDNYAEIFEFTEGNAYPTESHSDTLAVSAMGCEMMAEKRSYIIRDKNGGYYPCKEADFNKTYEPIEQ